MKAIIHLAGEINIKSKRVKRWFLSQLIQNIYQTYGKSVKVVNDWSKVWIFSETAFSIEPLTRIFGIASVHVIEDECESNFQTILELGQQKYWDSVKDKKFAVSVRRHPSLSFTSQELAKELGAKLYANAKGVDLENPEICIYVNCQKDKTYFTTEVVKGAGGLPIGVGERVLSLVSGGGDSILSSWMLWKRGVATDFLFFNLGGKSYEKIVIENLKELWEKWGGGTRPYLHVLDFSSVVAMIHEKIPPKYSQVFLKRTMYLIAEKLCLELKIPVFATGESLGQVSTQTLSNLIAISSNIKAAILRPLIAMDKQEIINQLKKINMFDWTSRLREYCHIAKEKPVTMTKPEKILEMDPLLDGVILEEVFKQRKTISIAEIKKIDLGANYLFVDQLSEKSTLVDLRVNPVEKIPGAVTLEYSEFYQTFTRYDKSKNYILICEHGLQSATMAEKMQERGFEAYSLRGGWESRGC